MTDQIPAAAPAGTPAVPTPVFVRLTEYPEVYGLTERTREKRKAEQLEDSAPLLIQPAQVGAILPRESYTTLIVQGVYVHVAHSVDETRALLGIKD